MKKEYEKKKFFEVDFLGNERTNVKLSKKRKKRNEKDGDKNLVKKRRKR